MNIVQIIADGETTRYGFASLRDARAYVASWRRVNPGIAAEITINGRTA